MIDTVRGTGQKIGLANHQFAHIHRVEGVNILSGVNKIENLGAVNMPGQGQLDQNPVNLGVFIQLINQRQQFCLTGIRRQVVPFRVDTQRL